MAALRLSFLRNLGVSWLTHGASLAIGFFLMPYVLHTLGDGSYGTWVFICSITSYATLLYLGFGETLGRYVAQFQARKEWDRLNDIVSLIVSIYVGMGMVAVTIAATLAAVAPYVFDWPMEQIQEIRTVMLLLGMNVAVGLCGSAFGGVLIGLRRFDIERGLACGADLLRLVLLLMFLQREQGLVIIAAVFLTVTLLENLGHVYYAFKLVPDLSIRWKHVKGSVLRDCLQFSGFGFLNAVAWQLTYATDTIVIGCYFGAKAIVPYQIALRLCHLLGQPILKIAEICMPTAGALHAESNGDGLRRLVMKAMGVSFLLAAGLFTGAAFFGDWLIANWVGTKYLSGHALLLVLFGTQVIVLPVGVLRSALFGMGCVRFPALLYVVEAAVNLSLSLALCGPLGLMGVALGTAIPMLVLEAGVMLPYGLRKLGIQPWQLLRDSIGPQLLPLGALLLYAKYVDSITQSQGDWFLLAAITVGGGVALGAGWLTYTALQRLSCRRAAA